MNRTSLKTSKIVSYPKSRSRKKGGLKDNLIPDKNDPDSKECSNQEYEIMKVKINFKLFFFILIIIDTWLLQDNLLLYNHARLMSQDNHSKEYLVSIMFSHYDRNNNGNLEREELEQVIFFPCFNPFVMIVDCIFLLYIYTVRGERRFRRVVQRLQSRTYD